MRLTAVITKQNGGRTTLVGRTLEQVAREFNEYGTDALEDRVRVVDDDGCVIGYVTKDGEHEGA
jgi:hypothetical protein